MWLESTVLDSANLKNFSTVTESAISAVIDERISLSEGMGKAGKFGIAEYRVCGASHLFWLNLRLWEQEVRGPMPVLMRTVSPPWRCLAQDHWIS